MSIQDGFDSPAARQSWASTYPIASDFPSYCDERWPKTTAKNLERARPPLFAETYPFASAATRIG